MEKLWFEIGVRKENGETETVLTCDTASEAISEFKRYNFNPENYFIDIWELENDGTPVPVANIDINYIMKGV